MKPIMVHNSEDLIHTVTAVVIMILIITIARDGVFTGHQAGTGDYLIIITPGTIAAIILIIMIRSIIPIMTTIRITTVTGQDIITVTGTDITDRDTTMKAIIIQGMVTTRMVTGRHLLQIPIPEAG